MTVDQEQTTTTIPAAPTPPPHLSPSAATTFTQCPRRWQRRYLERLPDPPGTPALVGTLTHRVLELLLNEPSGARTLDRARELAKVAWPEISAKSDFANLALDADGVREFKWRVWRAIEGLWHLEDPDGIEVEATEQRLEVTLGDVPFVGVIDRVDRVDGRLVVTDYKSGRPPRAGHVAEKLDQVLLYAGAVAEVTGEQPGRARPALPGRHRDRGRCHQRGGRPGRGAAQRHLERDRIELHHGHLCGPAWGALRLVSVPVELQRGPRRPRRAGTFGLDAPRRSCVPHGGLSHGRGHP